MNKTTNALITKMKTAFFAGIAFGAGLLTSGLFAAAAAMNIFSAGEVISAAKINQNFQIAAPEGVVSAFFRPDCPDGWAPADGTNGTPDLRGQFIRGRDDAGTGAAGRDPEGIRGVGAYQPDAFQSHLHWRNSSHLTEGVYTTASGPANAIFGPNGQLSPTHTGEPSVHGSYGDPRVATETRPKNVALTYCMRKN